MIKLIDNHGHIMFPEKINTTVNQAEELVKELRIDKISFLSWPPKAPDYMKIDYTENLKILYLKEKLEIPVYAYFAFDEYSKDANLNAEFIKLGMPQSERLISLNNSARNQIEILKNNNGIKELELLQERINDNNKVLIENK